MEELQKIIEGLRKAEKACGLVMKEVETEESRQYYEGKVHAYCEVIGVLEDFMTRYSVFAVKVWEVQEKRDKAMQMLAEDLKRERSN